MSKHQCTIAHYTFKAQDLADLLTARLETATNIEELAKKLLSDLLKDKNHEFIRGLQYDKVEDAWTAHVAFFIEG